MNAQTPAAFAQGFITAYMQGMQIQEGSRRWDAQMQLKAKNDLRQQQYQQQVLDLRSQEMKNTADYREKSLENQEDAAAATAENRAETLKQYRERLELDKVKNTQAVVGGTAKFLRDVWDKRADNKRADEELEETKSYHREMVDIAAGKVLFGGKRTGSSTKSRVTADQKAALKGVIDGLLESGEPLNDESLKGPIASILGEGATQQDWEDISETAKLYALQKTGKAAAGDSPLAETPYKIPQNKLDDLQQKYNWMHAKISGNIESRPSYSSLPTVKEGETVDYRGKVAMFGEAYKELQDIDATELPGYNPAIGNEEEARSAAIRELVKQFNLHAERDMDMYEQAKTEEQDHIKSQKKKADATRLTFSKKKAAENKDLWDEHRTGRTKSQRQADKNPVRTRGLTMLPGGY